MRTDKPLRLVGGAGPVRFVEKTHEYFVGADKVPSVTTVLESERLVDLDGVPEALLEYSRGLGKAVHRATELNDVGDLDDATLDPAIEPYLKAWKRFRYDTGFVVESLERVVFNPVYRYAGTLDRLGRFGGGRGVSAIIDIKTGAPRKSTGYQLAAYLGALPIVEQRNRRRFACHLLADGRYALVEYVKPSDWNVFLAALTLYNVRKEK